MPLPGWYYGQPVSEWGSAYGPTGGFSPMQYTEAAGGGWMWAERGTLGISTGTAFAAGGLMVAGIDPWVGGNAITYNTPHFSINW
jgi:hypothetical protein